MIRNVCYPKTLLSFLLMALLVIPLTGTAQAQSAEAARLYNQGIDYYNRGDVRQALNLFQQSVQIDNTYTDAYYNMGTVYFQQQQYDAAINAFQRVVQLNAADTQVYYNLALCYERKGDLAQAVSYLKRIPANDGKYQLAQSKIKRFSTVTQIPKNQQPIQQPAQPKIDNNYSANQYQLGGPSQLTKLPVETFAEGFFGPTGITAGLNGGLFVANYSKNAIYRVLPNGNKEVFAQGDGLDGPVGLVFNPRSQEFYVANYLGNTISRVSGSGVISSMASGLKKPYYLFLDPASNTLFISEQETNTVSRIKIN